MLDAALHAWGFVEGGEQLALPFSWQGVTLHAAGSSRLRVRLAPTGAGSVSVELADSAGLPVLSVRELVVRAVSEQALAAAAPAGAETGGGLLELVWIPLQHNGTRVLDVKSVWELPSDAHLPDAVSAVPHTRHCGCCRTT